MAKAAGGGTGGAQRSHPHPEPAPFAARAVGALLGGTQVEPGGHLPCFGGQLLQARLAPSARWFPRCPVSLQHGPSPPCFHIPNYVKHDPCIHPHPPRPSARVISGTCFRPHADRQGCFRPHAFFNFDQSVARRQFARVSARRFATNPCIRPHPRQRRFFRRVSARMKTQECVFARRPFSNAVQRLRGFGSGGVFARSVRPIPVFARTPIPPRTTAQPPSRHRGERARFSVAFPGGRDRESWACSFQPCVPPVHLA